jgi:tripartite-type tricarboxylate transporter receptor subunit TctC
MWLVKPNSTYKTVKDALASKDKINFAAGGPMDGLSDGAAFTCAALKLNCQVVLGYKGSADAVLAVTRGEMDAIYVSDTSANNYVKAGQAIAVASMGKTKSRFFPEIPTIFEATQLDADSKWLFDFRATVEDLGRILVVAPGTPPPRLAFLQDAVKKVLTDKAVIEEGEKTQRYVDYVDPEKTRAAVLAVVKNLSADQKERVKKILLPNG